MSLKVNKYWINGDRVLWCIIALLVIFSFLPIVLRESMIGIIFANFLFLGVVLIIAYSSLLIVYGRYPRIPILSEAAKLQVQRG